MNNIFLWNYILTLFWGVVLIYRPYGKTDLSEREKRKRKKIFVVLACVQWILISGLRADSVGNDTLNYMNIFDEHIELTWKDVFENFKKYFSAGTDEYSGFEPGFVLFERVVGRFTDNHVVYKFIVAIIFTTALGIYIYQNSEDPCMSFILYDGLFYNMFSLTGYRQVISVAIGILFGYVFIKNKKLVPFLILIVIASTFHKSTLFYVIFYFFANKKITRKYVFISMTAICIMIAYRTQLFEWVKVIAGYEEYVGNYGFKQQNFMFLLGLLTFTALWRYRLITDNNPQAVHYYNGLILAWAMMPLAMESPSSMRLVYDFAFVLMFLMPLIIKTFTEFKDKLMVYSAIFCFFAYSIALKTPEYEFFWQ